MTARPTLPILAGMLARRCPAGRRALPYTFAACIRSRIAAISSRFGP
jgi:hypothetical protein